MDNKISFIAGWFLTTATTVTAMGIFKAAVLGLVGGFFGLFGKEVYYYLKNEYATMWPKIKLWFYIKIENLKLKLQKKKKPVSKTVNRPTEEPNTKKHEK